MQLNTVPPIILPFAVEDLLNTGDSTGVSCTIVKGDLPINIKWTLNDSPVVNGENGVTIVKLSARASLMSIASVEEHHRGTVKCIAKNQAGADEYSTEMRVHGIFFLRSK